MAPLDDGDDACGSFSIVPNGVTLELRKLGRLIKPDGCGPYYDLVTRPFENS